MYVGGPYWNETYQDYSNLVGYAQVVYGTLHKTAKVTVITTTRDPSVVLTYSYNGVASTDNTFSVDGYSSEFHRKLITVVLSTIPCPSKSLEAMALSSNLKKSISCGKTKM